MRSYTRQPVVEWHTFGSPPLLEALLRTVCEGGARLAEPGEFTLRAFLAGRIDLVQAEAVLGIIDAEDRRQLDVALHQLAGGLTRPLQAIRDQLLNLLADLEAGLDFVEEDIHFVSHEQLNRRLDEAATAIGLLADQMQSRGRSDCEPRVVLCGPPNAGKSSLFNALVGDAAAIVAPSAGTTRDYLTAKITFENVAWLLIDTAGWEPAAAAPADGEAIAHAAAHGASSAIVERSGIATAAQAMTREQQRQADLEIFCVDATQPLDERRRLELNAAASLGRSRLVVLTKCDLAAQRNAGALHGPGIQTSSMTGAGCDLLKREIHRSLTTARSPAADGAVAATAVRCGDSLRSATECLVRAKRAAQAGGAEELVAAEIRGALMELGSLVGAIHTDDLLDRIFSRFCIGK